jgi:hypothetical protein
VAAAQKFAKVVSQCSPVKIPAEWRMPLLQACLPKIGPEKV